MKKVLFFSLAALMALCACEKTGLDNAGFGEKDSFATLTASTSPVTRTSIDGSLHLLWSAKDSITVFKSLVISEDAQEGDVPYAGYGLASGAGTAQGSFTGAALAYPAGGLGYAIYPHRSDADKSVKPQETALIEKGIVRYIPRYQTYVENSIPENTFVMAGSFNPADGKVNFRPMSAVLEIKMYGRTKISEIQVAAKDENGAAVKQMCGNAFLIVFDAEGNPSLTTEGSLGGNANVFLECPDVQLGADAEHATSFFIVVCGAASFHHLDVTVTNNEGSSIVKSTKPAASGNITLSPGTVYSLPAFEVKFKTVLAKWASGNPNGIYDPFKIGATGATVTDKETQGAPASTGSGYIKFKNNDESAFRTAYSSPSFVVIPATQGDEIIVAATNCSVSAGATVRLLANLWLYRNNTASTYELDFSTDGTNWTKLEDYTFTAVSTNGNTEGSHFDVDKTVELSADATSVFFRFLATNNAGTSGNAPDASGQTRLRPNKAESDLAIYKE